MVILKGKGVCGGIVSGTLQFYEKKSVPETQLAIEDTGAEIARLRTGIAETVSQLERLHTDSLETLGEENAQIFQIHAMMLADEDFIASMTGAIADRKINAEWAVREAGAEFERMLSDTGDAYISGRGADVRDVCDRLVCVLSDAGAAAGPLFDSPAILAAADLAPSETVQLDRTKVLSFVTRQGTTNSHSAIIARSMNIPAVVGLGDELSSAYDGMEAIVDGFTGLVCIDPDEATKRDYAARIATYRRELSDLDLLKGAGNVTLDGKAVEVYANIGSDAEVASALLHDAGGIGLLRSEFLYLERSDFPSEDDLFSAYKSAAMQMNGKKVIIRTVDIGADKQAAYFNLPSEENPAMGMRAVRICLTRPEIFLTQLRAILRASAFGKVAVMFPMIISTDEVRRCRAFLDDAKKSLDAASIAYDRNIECGIMVETPAAALISAELAKEADFFSIGSNDLTQYTLAIDRQNPALDAFCDPHHAAVLALIEMTVRNAHAAGIWTGICGELGADLSLTERFLRMGMDEFSVSPSAVLPLRRKIREIRLDR